jgi:shikimate kinase
VTRPLVVLVGPPGAGKTTIGRLLSDRRGVEFRDTDADIEAATGQRIADIFVEHGEEHFRALERDAVRRALTEHAGVLALGGGAVMDDGTRSLLASHTVVFLDVHVADAAARVGLNRDRPLLLGNPRAQLQQLMDARRPVYEEVATVTVPTDGRSPEEIVADVEAALR